MNISFNVTDAIGEQFISASRYSIPNRPDLTDDRVCNKNLKNFIGTAIDDFSRSLALATDEANLVSLKQQYFAAESALIQKRHVVDESITPTNLGD